MVDLNDFVAGEFQITPPDFNPEIHCPIPPFNTEFFSALGLPMEPQQNSERTIHPYSWALAETRLNMHSKLLVPLARHLADPLLTTVQFSRKLDPVYQGLSIKFGKGIIVCR